MEFFDKKEEVLEVILTQKGREMFASGSFKPAYYSFYDTDIVYESKLSEEQNGIVPRIKQTPTLKQNTNVYQNSNNSATVLQTQKLYCELGNKALSDQYKPAWQLNFKKSPSFQYIGNRNDPIDTKKYKINLSSSFDNNNANQEFIPQIDIQTIYNIAKLAGTQQYYLIKDNPIILDISEFNSFEGFEKQEFEIETFLVNGTSVINDLSFNKDIDENIFKYLKVVFDKLADFEEKINTDKYKEGIVFYRNKHTDDRKIDVVNMKKICDEIIIIHYDK